MYFGNLQNFGTFLDGFVFNLAPRSVNGFPSNFFKSAGKFLKFGTSFFGLDCSTAYYSYYPG